MISIIINNLTDRLPVPRWTISHGCQCQITGFLLNYHSIYFVCKTLRLRSQWSPHVTFDQITTTINSAFSRASSSQAGIFPSSFTSALIQAAVTSDSFSSQFKFVSKLEFPSWTSSLWSGAPLGAVLSPTIFSRDGLRGSSKEPPGAKQGSEHGLEELCEKYCYFFHTVRLGSLNVADNEEWEWFVPSSNSSHW